jgi:acyl-CoA synthetase (AMP-forming)/AMP-acid ligase II
MLAARADAPEPAMVEPDGTAWTTGELLGRASGAADWLERRGVPVGEPLVAFVAATPASGALLLAGATTNRPLAPLSPRFTVDELTACVARLGGTGPLLSTPEAEAVVEQVAARTGRPVLLVPPEFERGRRDLPLDQGPDDVVAVVHTSGTTAVPKPVFQHQGPMAPRVGQSADPIRLGPGDRYATASAFHHQAGVGLWLVAMGAGCTLLPFPSFSPDSWRRLEALRPTHATIVPALLETLLEADVLALPTLRWIQYGSSPLHPDTAARLLADFPELRLTQQLGQTEGSPITTLTHEDHIEAVATHPHRLRSVGRPVPRSELRIEEPDDEGVGEICSRADHYFAPDPDGWLRTGDLGWVDPDGFVYLSGRKQDVINRGGDKIHPVEVERVITSHAGVREVAVAGVADRRLGHVPHAFVVPTDPAAPPDFADVQAFARDQLAGYKVPRDWHLVPELPRNPSGKVLRRLLAASVEAEQ